MLHFLCLAGPGCSGLATMLFFMLLAGIKSLINCTLTAEGTRVFDLDRHELCGMYGVLKKRSLCYSSFVS